MTLRLLLVLALCCLTVSASAEEHAHPRPPSAEELLGIWSLVDINRQVVDSDNRSCIFDNGFGVDLRKVDNGAHEPTWIMEEIIAYDYQDGIMTAHLLGSDEYVEAEIAFVSTGRITVSNEELNHKATLARVAELPDWSIDWSINITTEPDAEPVGPATTADLQGTWIAFDRAEGLPISMDRCWRYSEGLRERILFAVDNEGNLRQTTAQEFDDHEVDHWTVNDGLLTITEGDGGSERYRVEKMDDGTLRLQTLERNRTISLARWGVVTL